MNEGLLDYIARQCNLYVSDLRLQANSAIVLLMIKKMNSNLFTADDWSCSLSYVFEKPLYFLTSTVAKEYYIKNLRMSLSHNSDK